MMHHSSVAENIAVAILMSLMVLGIIIVALTQGCQDCDKRRRAEDTEKEATCVRGIGWPK